MVHYDTEFLVSNGDASPVALFPVSSDANAKGNTTEIPHLAGLRNYQSVAASRLQALFPTSQIIKVRVTFWPETLIACGREC